MDRSIIDPLGFVYDNVVATCNILNFARKLDRLERIIYFSTDEVFVSLKKFYIKKETDTLQILTVPQKFSERVTVAFENSYKTASIYNTYYECFWRKATSESTFQ